MKRLCTSIIAAAALTALVVPTSQAMLERLLPSKNVHARIAKASTVVHKKETKPGSVIGSSCGATWSYCDRTASASRNDAVQPGSASSGSTDEQLCALSGMNCDAIFLSSVNDASQASNASASANGTVQPGSASIGYVDGQLSACWGLTCDAEYPSSVNDSSPASNASPPYPPSPTYNDGAGT
jgi:hypothetical protein